MAKVEHWDRETERRGVVHPQRPDHLVAVIGAGIGGIGMGIALRKADIRDFVVLERASDIGGTWRDNTYPGVASDIPAHAYQFSFELQPEWKRVYATGSEIKRYIDHCADHYDVRRAVRLNTDVIARSWDEGAAFWRLQLSNGTELTARFVVTALGPFGDPNPPSIEGIRDFAGEQLHSAAWDHSIELAGKRVAVIGTGASAVQLIPELAQKVDHLDVFQRTAIWVGPKIDLPTTPLIRAVLRRVPLLHRIARRALAGLMEFFLVFMVVHYRLTAWIPKVGKVAGRGWYGLQVRDPATRRKLFPDYEIGCKRPSVSNDYLRTFNRGNVELITAPIERVTATGVRTADGQEHPVDVLVLATGFRVASDPENFRRVPVTGRDGLDLAEVYESQRLKAYEGISMPGFPNQFMIFGPYGWVGGSWHQLVEASAAHIVRVIEESRKRGAAGVEVLDSAATRWTADMRERIDGSLWARGDCSSSNSYYYDHHGDPTFLRPTSSARARHASRNFPLSDYRFWGIVVPPRVSGSVQPTGR